MGFIPKKLLLADDDTDDCIFFREALEELPITSFLKTVHDGAELMSLLTSIKDNLPDLLFMDLNMPRKNGYECLEEIKLTAGLRHLPVIIFSTSFEPTSINWLYETGAHYYIRKPAHFSDLRNLIHQAILLMSGNQARRPNRENFVLNRV